MKRKVYIERRKNVPKLFTFIITFFAGVAVTLIMLYVTFVL